MKLEKDIKKLQREYWKKLTNELINNYPMFNPKKGSGNSYYLPMGNKFTRISMSINSVKKIQECKIIISNKPRLYNYLEKNKEQIEDRINFKLNWEFVSDSKAYIGLFKDFDIRNEDSWDEAIKWHLEMASMLSFGFSIWISYY